MKTEQIEQRILDLKNEIYSLDSLKDSYDDVNPHSIEDQIDYLIKERNSLIELLESSFDNMIGL